ncbi:40S ribosomal protein s4 [Phtheirospermum japonicum]|uniref:40S ribosomal protein s4 n=1 Tax=Phtheirospermum japonicum TaxID=374723 RepID=A0A830D4Y6_9LAMI|nr:40S ribosomal protein s4 [Phtheirospermum japonicum]
MPNSNHSSLGIVIWLLRLMGFGSVFPIRLRKVGFWKLVCSTWFDRDLSEDDNLAFTSAKGACLFFLHEGNQLDLDSTNLTWRDSFFGVRRCFIRTLQIERAQRLSKEKLINLIRTWPQINCLMLSRLKFLAPRAMILSAQLEFTSTTERARVREREALSLVPTSITQNGERFEETLEEDQCPKTLEFVQTRWCFCAQTIVRPHKSRECLPLILILRNRLKYALTYREVIAILMQRHIQVDRKRDKAMGVTSKGQGY